MLTDWQQIWLENVSRLTSTVIPSASVLFI